MAISQAGRTYRTPSQVKRRFAAAICASFFMPVVAAYVIGEISLYTILPEHTILNGLGHDDGVIYGVLGVLLGLFVTLGLSVEKGWLRERYQQSLAQAYADEAAYLAKTALPFQKSSFNTIWAEVKRFLLFFVPTLTFVALAALAANEWFGGELLHRGHFVLNGAGFWVAFGGFVVAVATFISRERMLGRYAETKLSIEPKTENGLVELSWRKEGHPAVWVRAWKYQKEMPHGIEDEAHLGNPRERIVNTTQGQGVFPDPKVRVGETGFYGFVLQAEGPSFYPVEKTINLQFETVPVYLPPVVPRPVEKEPEKPIGEQMRERIRSNYERVAATAASEIEGAAMLNAQMQKDIKEAEASGLPPNEIKDRVDFIKGVYRDLMTGLKTQRFSRK